MPNTFAIYDQEGNHNFYKIASGDEFKNGFNNLLNSLQKEQIYSIKVFGDDVETPVINQEVKPNTFKDNMMPVVKEIANIRTKLVQDEMKI